MSAIRAGRVCKHRRSHVTKSPIGRKIMAIMQDRNSEKVPKEFLETGRTGRRNAMPDILQPQGGADVPTSDLPSRLQQMVIADLDNPQPSTSKSELDVNKGDDPPPKKDSCS